MASRMKFEQSQEIGCFMKLTNNYCIVAAGYADQMYDGLAEQLNVPVIPCTISGMKIIGRMIVGNKNGLLVPDTITDEEW